MGLSKQGIDALATLGVTASYRVIAAKRCKLLKARDSDLEMYFQEQLRYAHFLNVDDYHDIHEKRVPNVTSLHSINHMATICVNLSKYCTPIPYCSPLGFNIHNPEFIDANIIISKLRTEYMQVFGTSYTDRKKEWNCIQEIANLSDDTLIDNLTIHIYDSDIAERKEERAMKDVKLVDLLPLDLHSMDAYLKAINAYAQHKNMFRDAFAKSVNYPYTRQQLKQLEEMSAEFLLSLFIDIRNKCDQSSIISSRRRRKCFLAAFNAEVDIKWLPIGYHVLKKPLKNKFCDATKCRLGPLEP
ncbi:10032_t:CDS:2, partial [Scutellospora calospora]